MAIIEWTDELSVNVKEIDEQHRKLVEMINELHSTHIENKNVEAQKSIIFKMLNYAATHFLTEEKYMVRFNYPEFIDHKKEHDNFTAKAFDLKIQIENGTDIFTLDLINFLKDWLQDHISVTDQKYSKFFNDNGLT